MAQVCNVIQADPTSLAAALLALNKEVLIIEKTSSAGKFLVVSQAPATGQTFTVVSGDPAKLAAEITTLIGGGDTINIIAQTFSASQYVVVST